MTAQVLTAGSDATAKLWRIDQNGKLQHVWTLTGHVSTGSRLSGHAAAIWDVSFSSDGRLAATAADDFTVRVWDVEEQSCVHVLEGHEGWVTAVQVSSRGVGSSTAAYVDLLDIVFVTAAWFLCWMLFFSQRHMFRP